MEKVKTKVLKSKSSNTTISKDNRSQDKKSRSNAEIPPFSFKKRGVYVEKKTTKTSMTEEMDNMPKKPKVIPRPARKKFLDSILTILSQSTTGTQYPELETKEKSNKMKIRKKKIYAQNEIGDLNVTKKQPKYRSKILNEYKDLEVDNVVVLQSKKEIIQTPSNYSQRSKDKVSIKWSEFIPKVNSDATSTTKIKALEKDDSIRIDQIDSEKTLIAEVEPEKEKIKEIATVTPPTEEPTTLVAKNNQKHDPKLYNFFVDLLETTLNVYNVKMEPQVVNTSSKLALETTESTTNKLNFENTINLENSINYFDDDPRTRLKSRHDFYMTDDWDDTLLDNVQSMSLRDISPEHPLVESRERRRLKPDSQKKKTKIPSPGTRSFIYQKFPTPPRKMIKKDRKKNLLNLFKEQLRIEDDFYEPPKNFFESLQVMAKYKKRCQKTIHFDESTKKGSEGNVFDCMYKRRKVLSSKNSYRSSTHTDKSFRSFSYKTGTSSGKKSHIETLNNDAESRLSLAVYTLDIIEPTVMNEKQVNKGTYDPILSSRVSSGSTMFGSVIDQESFDQW